MELSVRHIQDNNEPNTTLQHHWGYPSRVLPCTKDGGTCAYLDAVYAMHDTSMLYTFILWAVILGVLTIWAAMRIREAEAASQGRKAFFDGVHDRLGSLKRWLLPDAPMRWLFGRVSRVQAAGLVVMLAYLLVFSLVGIVYKTWVTPIKGSAFHNTRTGLGGFSDRVGALAYALTPFAILLCQRESILSMVTGIPYQHFNFLHRWLGRIIFVQSFLHTLGWTIVEGKLYQPQPSVYAMFMAEQYIIFGVVAMLLITFLTVFSTQKAIRWTGYEFFKVTHWIVAVLYIGACWGHWDKLWCWMVASLALIVIDQVGRALRTISIHGETRKSSGFKAVQADMKVLTDDNGTVLRLDLEQDGTMWHAGQHFYLTFPSLSIWQSHPFTVSSLSSCRSGRQHHVYLIRVREGITKRLLALGDTTPPVILSGPYGHGYPKYESQHLFAVAGGTGVSFTLPIIQAAVAQITNRQAVLHFVWVIRKAEDLLWLGSEIEQLKTYLDKPYGLRIKIFVSRDHRPRSGVAAPSLISSEGTVPTEAKDDTIVASTPVEMTVADLLAIRHASFSIEFLQDHHPAVSEIVADFAEQAADVGGAMEIVGSGPEAMGSDLRAAVAQIRASDGVSFYWDSRE